MIRIGNFENRRRNEMAVYSRGLSDEQRFCVLRRVTDQLVQSVMRIAINHRTELAGWIVGTRDLQASADIHQSMNQRIEHRTDRHHARCRGALLPGVAERTADDAEDRFIQIGIVIDDADEALAEGIRASGFEVLVAQTYMRTAEDRLKLARAVLEFARAVRLRKEVAADA